MFYSDELLEEIRLQNDIVSVVSEYLPLKQKGGSYFGLCPFHSESTPSFSVNAEKQFYYCFGCGAGGDIFTFIMQMENCSFLEAINTLAKRGGVKLPEPKNAKAFLEKERLNNTLIEIHRQAGLFFYSALQGKDGEPARKYLEKRQISLNTQRKFGLGYSDNNRQSLHSFLKSKGFNDSELVLSGLIMKDKNGNGYYDRFYDRIMFPIFDINGKPIAFGGRILKSGEPKYLNSPETPIFSKSRNLFGLNLAKKERASEIILVEGYMDMISLYQAGFKNVAASLGTAFNKDHANSLKKVTSDVILLFDSDEAGERAVLRAIPVLISSGFRVRVCQVTDAKDPDEFIKKYGVKEFSRLIFNSLDYISFQINCIKKKYDLNNSEHKIKFTSEAANLLASVESSIERDVFIKNVSKMTEVSEDAIKKEIDRIIFRQDSNFMSEAEKKRVKIRSENFSSAIKKSKGLLESQRDILYICANYADIYKEIKKYLSPFEFSEDIYKKMATIIYEMNDKGEKILPTKLIQSFETIEEQRLATEVFAVNIQYNSIDDMEKAINSEIMIIKQSYINTVSSSSNDVEEINRIVFEISKMKTINIKISK